MSMPTRLSVCIPTKNVEDTIDECLASVQSLADEIVILDSNSTDGTLNICEEYGANIHQHDFEGFARLRRELIEHASNEWVLLLDADESLSPELREEIDRRLGASDNLAYRIPKKVKMFGQWVRIGQTARPWLFKKGVVKISDELVHEQPVVREEFEDRTETLSNPILHRTYEGLSEYLNKLDHYTSLEALEAVDSGDNPRLTYVVLRGFGLLFYRLFIQRAILEGYVGIFFAVGSLQYEILSYGKIQELRRVQEQNPESWRTIWLEEYCQR